MATLSVLSCTTEPLNSSLLDICKTATLHVYDEICSTTKWLDRKLVDVTNTLFKNPLLAAITRVTIKTLGTYALYAISPFPMLISYALLNLGQWFLNGGDHQKPGYGSTAIQTDLLYKSATCSLPFMGMISTYKYSPLSIILHSLATLASGYSLYKKLEVHCMEELM